MKTFNAVEFLKFLQIQVMRGCNPQQIQYRELRPDYENWKHLEPFWPFFSLFANAQNRHFSTSCPKSLVSKLSIVLYYIDFL